MEFYRTKLYGGEVNVLFTGSFYYFYHGFHGLVAIAERMSEPGDEDVLFDLVAYDGTAATMAKRVITKAERRYVEKTSVEYNVALNNNLNNEYYVTAELNER